MATKKQKRLIALTKRAEFEAEEKARGLEFQKKDQALRDKKFRAAMKTQHDEKHGSGPLSVEGCPFCADDDRARQSASAASRVKNAHV